MMWEAAVVPRTSLATPRTSSPLLLKITGGVMLFVAEVAGLPGFRPSPATPGNCFGSGSWFRPVNLRSEGCVAAWLSAPASWKGTRTPLVIVAGVVAGPAIVRGFGVHEIPGLKESGPRVSSVGFHSGMATA